MKKTIKNKYKVGDICEQIVPDSRTYKYRLIYKINELENQYYYHGNDLFYRVDNNTTHSANFALFEKDYMLEKTHSRLMKLKNI